MVEFKTWKDTYLFILNYGRFSCLNCKHCDHNMDLSVDHSDFEYSHHFCTEWAAMVDFGFQFVCEKWSDDEGNTVDGKEDECAFNLPQNVLDALVNEDKKWTFEEIRELMGEGK